MALYQATTQQVEELTNTTGTGYPSIDRPWLSYYSKEAIEDPLPDMTLFEYLYENNKYNLDSDALNYMGHKITYRELFKRIDQAAKAFLAQGVQEGDIVSILTVASVPCVVCYYALNRIGAVVDFINVLSTAKDLVKFFRANKSKLVVSADIFMNKALLAAKAMGVEKVIAFSMEDDLPFFKKVGTLFQSNDSVDESYLSDPVVMTWDKFIAAGTRVPDIEYKKDPDAPALLAHTGGTTGFPKSVMLSDNALNAVAFQYHYIFHLDKKEPVFLNLVVPFVVYGSLINMHMPLTMSATVVLIPNFDPEDWPEYFNKYTRRSKGIHICGTVCTVAEDGGSEIVRQIISGQRRVAVQKPVIKTTCVIVGSGVHTDNQIGNAGAVQFPGESQRFRFPDLARGFVAHHIGEFFVVRLDHSGNEIPTTVYQFEGRCQ